MRGKWFLVFGAVALLALGAAAVWVVLQRQPASTGSRPDTAVPPGGQVLSLSAKIEAVEVVAVPVPVEGRIESFAVDVGADVYEGELLATIRSGDLETRKEASAAELNRLRNRVSSLDSSLIAARLEASRARESAGEAQTAMETARKALERQQLLFEKGAAARQSLEKSQAVFAAAAEVYAARQKVVQAADSRVAELSRNHDDAQKALEENEKEQEEVAAMVVSGDVISPVNGFVISRRGAVGQEATYDMEDLFQIAVNLTALRAVADIPPDLRKKVRAGQEAVIQIAELADGVPATVTEVRDNQVVIDFTSPNPLIKPGITAQIAIKPD
ncbi:MAG: hypothetical protein IT159_02905 [Bryobacterales bacterium]|nr:hypothetical protein [Bryobacterales bacterium]